jgi:hypothetical protein
MTNVFGGTDTKTYIIETTGPGVAVSDYDNDGWPDIFIVNGRFGKVQFVPVLAVLLLARLAWIWRAHILRTD